MLTAAPSANVLFLTHPQVAIDPAIPVPDWTLSQLGADRMVRFAASPVLARVTAIYSSGERKAVDTARILSERTGHTLQRGGSPARERSLRDRLPAARPVRGGGGPILCRARDQRARLGAGSRRAVADCRLRARHRGSGRDLRRHRHCRPWWRRRPAAGPPCQGPISRRLDQPGSGGGNFLVCRRDRLALVHAWRSVDTA